MSAQSNVATSRTPSGPSGNGRPVAAQPFAAEFDRAIQRAGTTLVQLRSDLSSLGTSVSLSTLSYWRSGARRPEGHRSVSAVTVIERVLKLDPGALTRHLPMAQQVQLDERDIEAVMERGPEVVTMLERLGGLDVRDLSEISTHLTMDLDENGDMRKFSYRTIWRANRDRLTAAPFIITLEPSIGYPELTKLVGFCAGPMLANEDKTVFGCRLEFTQPPARGAQVITEVHGCLPPGLSEPDLSHSLPRNVTELVLWLRFHRQKVPVSAESYTTRDGITRTQPLTVDGPNLFTRHDHEPAGVIGISWTW